MAFLVATTSLPAVYPPNGYARTTNAGTPHARAKNETEAETGGYMTYFLKPNSRRNTKTHIASNLQSRSRPRQDFKIQHQASPRKDLILKSYGERDY